jgi:hypothetical protein
VPDREHYLKEAPYLVMEAGRKSWGAQCVCGWRSVLYDSEDELMAVVRQHFENPEPAEKRKWWQRKKKNPYSGIYNRRN